MINQRKNFDERKYKLIYEYEEIHKYFQDTYTYVPNLFKSLWNQPKVIAKLITNSNLEDIKNNLAYFFMNNFFENILSSSYMEDNLMYVITLVLMDEIKSINNTNDFSSFLDNTAGGYFLEQLKYKTDVLGFFKIIILHLVEKLENISSSKKINFNVKQIQEDFLKMKEIMEEKFQKTGEKSDIINNDFFKKNFLLEYEKEKQKAKNEQSENYKRKKEFSSYIPNITNEEIEKKISEYESNKGMEEYCNNLITKAQTAPKIFSNDNFLANVFDSSVGQEVLALYEIDFFKVMEIIDELFNSLLNNMYLIPYSVKCICKIIITLLKKKFKNMTIIEENIFLSIFFFNKIFLPAFREPKSGSFINNFMISGVLIHNLEIISEIIEKLVSFSFIKSDEDNGDFSPFNRYFLDKMPTVLKFFENISKVKLPSFIEKILNEGPEKNYVYNYFEENKEEIISHRSICCSLDDFLVLLNNIDKCKDLIFKDNTTRELKITFEKVFISNKEIIDKLKSKEEYEVVQIGKKKKVKQETKILNFFLFTQLLINDKYKDLFELRQEKPNFSLKELNTTKTDVDKQKNNVIKVKNLFSGLLYNYQNLVKTDFDEGTTVNTIKILKELKKFMKSSNFVIDGSIPSEWYVDSLFECLKFLPQNLINNDYENLYDSLSTDINNSMKKMDFELMSLCLGKVKFANRNILNYENLKNALIEIELNEKVQTIIEKTIIPVTINLKLTSKEKEIKIEKAKSIKEIPFLDIFKDDSDKKMTCPTIESFGKKFPDLGNYLKKNFPELDQFEFEEELNLVEELKNYFSIIKEHLTKKLEYEESQTEYEIITNKIYDYIMEKLYDKIYPSEPNIQDNVIFTQCILLSWVEPKHLIKEKNNYLFDSFLPDVINYFDKIDKEKSPRKKLENMVNIFLSIGNVVKFNGENKDIGVDDQLPILNYAFIKARPFPIYTNCKYMELFIGSKKYRLEGNYLTQLFTLCKFISDLGANDLFNVSEEQFKSNCAKSRELEDF